MKKWLSLFLAMLLMLSLTAPAYAFGDRITSGAGGKTGVTVTLTRVGEADGKTVEDAVDEAAGLVSWRGGMAQLLDWRGNPVGGSYDAIEPLCDGYWLVYRYDYGVNCCGLMKDDGTMLIPISAAMIREVNGKDFVNRWQAKLRYLEVVYAEEELSGDDGAFLYVHYTPYSGHSLYYDLERGRFVGDLRRDSASEMSYSVVAVGDKLFFGNRRTVYDENGAAVLQDEYLSAENGFFIRTNSNDYSVLNSGLQELARFPVWPNTFEGDDAFFKLCENDWYRIMDRSGRQLGELQFYLEPEEWGNFFFGMDNGGRYLAMDRSGRTILSAADGVTDVNPAPCGFLQLDFASGDCGLLFPDGSYVRGLGGDGEFNGLFATREIGGNCSVLVLEDRDFSLSLPEGAVIDLLEPYDWGAPVLAVIEDENGMGTLVNLVNGEKLMKVDCGDSYYSPFVFANDYLYVFDSEAYIYQVYRVEISC